MTKENYKIKDVETGKIFTWSLAKILHEINRDRSEDWTDYNVSDWREGWDHWIEGDGYLMLEEEGL